MVTWSNQLNPKFTIIVPTVNRPETLLHTLKTLVDQSGDDYEILVSDNQGPVENVQIVQSFELPEKIRYIRTASKLSMRGNYEFAVGHAKGAYVTILGDDDGFVPNGMQVIRNILAKSQSEPEVLFWFPHMYWWPNALIPIKCNMLYVYANPKNAIFVNPRSFVDSLFQNESKFWQFERLPSIYNGFVHVTLLERIRSRIGTYFHDETPDVFSGIANGTLAQSGMLIERPISIRGLSGKSVGVAFRNKKAGAALRQELKQEAMTSICAPELIDSTALAVHIASARLRAIHLFEELSQYQINIPILIQGILNELPEDPDRFEDLIHDASQLAKKYNIEFIPPDRNTIIYQQAVKRWGLNIDREQDSCMLSINCELNGVRNIDDASKLIYSILGD